MPSRPSIELNFSCAFLADSNHLGGFVDCWEPGRCLLWMASLILWSFIVLPVV